VILPPACETPCPDLSPLPDSAGTRSQYEGRGLTGGIQLEFPLWKNNLVIEGSVAVSVLRGDIDLYYNGSNSYYIETDGGGDFVQILCATPDVCESDYETFDDTFLEGNNIVYQADRIAQRNASISLSDTKTDQSSLVVENDIAIRWRTPYKRLEVFGGFRQSRYGGVAVELRPTVQAGAPDEDGNFPLTLVGGVTENERSVTYEGFYGGVTIRLY